MGACACKKKKIRIEISGKFLMDSFRYDNAIMFYLRKIHQRTETNHPNIENSYKKLGRCMYHFGKYEETIEILTKCLDFCSTKTKDDLYMCDIYKMLANCYEAVLNYSLAVEFFIKTQKILVKYHKKRDKIILDLYLSISKCYTNQGKFNLSIKYTEKARKHLESESYFPPDLADIYINLGTLNRFLRKYDVSYHLYKTAAEILLKYFPPFSIFLEHTYLYIGMSCEWLGNIDEAEQYYLFFIKSRETSCEKGDMSLINSYELMIDFYSRHKDIKTPKENYAEKCRNVIIEHVSSKGSVTQTGGGI
ncbi:hypothetical protein SteCoe_15609 [Stentor coeruleus]|uniref:Tetratricopeptide repeat protein n=1 Tax=Stentor coeruleus TaxID=5963 RepID=A0A1R2C382_9CILI|nr:hypothetical protein SteCoe_15609 [Stentor coeruleus]